MTKGCAMRLADLVCATVVTAALFAAPGCSRVVAGNAVQGANAPGAESSQCAQVSGPMTSIRPHAASEPQLRIPQPRGWHRASMLDSEIIRFTMTNKTLAARNFVPSAVVTLEFLPGSKD